MADKNGSSKPLRIVIAGAGFGGLYTALYLQRFLPRGLSAEVTLLNEENFFLFTPLFSEVITGDVEPSHILTAVRSSLADPRFLFHQAAATEVDLEQKILTAFCAKGHCLKMPYDYLVIAVGGQARLPDTQSSNGKGQWVFPLKTLTDALLLHNQVLDMFEHAEMLSKDSPERKQMLTFVVVGGGFAGVETVAALHDMIYGTLLRQYPHINGEEVKIFLLHGGDRILPELTEELASYADRFMNRWRIEIKLGVHASLPSDGVVSIGETKIETKTLIWTAGSTPMKFVEELPFGKDKGGRIVVDCCGRVAGHSNIFCLGDCAHQENPRTGQSYPPTAQVAIKQAKMAARNIAALAGEKELMTFSFSPAGMVVPLGRRKAVAIVKGVRLRGLPAWWFSRTLYLLRLPTWSNRLRVVVDWTLDIFFPRDTTRISVR